METLTLHPDLMNPLLDSGDHIHPNPTGYAAMGNSINLAIFESISEWAPAKKYEPRQVKGHSPLRGEAARQRRPDGSNGPIALAPHQRWRTEREQR